MISPLGIIPAVVAMLQSVRILQVALQVAVVLLVAVAVSVQSWDVIEFKSAEVSRISARDNVNPAQQLSFSPSGYCINLANGTSDCQPFLNAILENSIQRADWPNAAPDPLAVLPSLLTKSNTSTEDFVVAQALSCWCQTRGELTWYMHGAQNVACLVVLETTKYSLALWGIAAVLSLGLSTTLAARDLAVCRALCSYASLMLGLLANLVWWYYSSTYIDREYLSELTVDWHHGASFYCALIALALAAANAQIAFDASSSCCSSRNRAKLHMLPPSGLGRPEELDPLSCPANYVV